MSGERFLIDTHFVQALFSRTDAYHEKAKQFLPRLRDAQEAWITEAVLVEIANALAASNRRGAIRFIEQSYRTPNMRVVPVERMLMERSLELYRNRVDKAWGLTDCISFVVMADERLTDAVTADAHFLQAGFRALLLE